jgi:hypothetical protein
MIKRNQLFFSFLNKVLPAFILASFFLGFSANKAQALDTCSGVQSGVGVLLDQFEDGDSHSIVIDMSGSDYRQDEDYFLKVKNTYNTDDEAQTGWFRIDTNKTYNFGNTSGGGQTNGTVTVKNGIVTWTIYREEALKSAPTAGDPDTHYVRLFADQTGSNRYCDVGTYQTTKNNAQGQCSLYVYQVRNGKTCYSSGCIDRTDETVDIEVENLEDADGNSYSGKVKFKIVQKGAGGAKDVVATATNGKASATFKADATKEYTIEVQEDRAGKNFPFPGCTTTVNVKNSCGDENCDEVRTDVSGNAIIRDFELCEQILNDEERSECDKCFSGSGSGGEGGVWTAIGCIPARPENIIKTFITLGISVGGGATLLLILTGAFRLTVSQGDPQATKDAKEQITSAVIGLVFILLSITILRFIGVSLFQIPGFGG